MLKLLALLAALAGSGVFAATAAADAPVVVERNATVVREFTGLTDCQAYGYSFTFTARYVIKRSDVLYYDRSGSLVKQVRHVRFVGTNTNDVTGTSVRDTGSRHITFDFVANTFTETGVLRHVTVPGSGIVLHEAARIVISLTDDPVIFMAGPHQLFAGDVAEFCAALADS